MNSITNQHEIHNILVSLESMAKLMKQGFYDDEMPDDLLMRVQRLSKIVLDVSTVDQADEKSLSNPLK